MKKETFAKIVSKLEAEGYILDKNPTDIDTIDPEKSIKIYGWWNQRGPNWMPNVSNRHHFNKDEAEALGQKIEDIGLPLAVHINGWYDDTISHRWIYDIEVTPSDSDPEIIQITLLWNTGEETQVMPPYPDKIIEAFNEEINEMFVTLDFEYDISRECDKAKAEEKIKELTKED